ncbi:MAG: hypothetical protein AAFP13_01585 [Pseudomonadota bacterium]
MPGKPKIIYYSRTGHSRHLAEDLARRLEGTLCELSTRRYRWPVLGAVAAGRDALLGVAPEVSGLDELPEADDLIVLVGPVWAGRPAAPLLPVIKRLSKTEHRVAIALTCGDPRNDDAAITKAREHLGREFVSQSIMCSNRQNWLLDNIDARRFALECNAGVDWQG